MIIRSKAPLRLGLAGGGTDVSPYCDMYGGVILNVTIDMYSYCTIIPTTENKIEFISQDLKKTFSCKTTEYIEPVGDLIIHKGVFNKIKTMFCKNKNLSFRMLTYSDAPAGSGLGSSSTMVVAMLKAYMEWLNLPLGEYDMAKLAYEIERKDLLLAGGKQDQYAATFGGLNFMEFGANEQVIVNPLRIKKWIKNELENMLVLYYTGVSRESAKIIKEQITNSTKQQNINYKNSMDELKRTAYKMKKAILQGDFCEVVECLNHGWFAKKNSATSITNPHIDFLYDFIMKRGGKAAKISGAGGGGFMMILCNPEDRYNLIRDLKMTQGTVMQVSFTERGAEAWTLY